MAFPCHAGPIAVMLADNAAGREYVRGMAEARMGPPDWAALAEAFDWFEAEEMGVGVHKRAVTPLAALTAVA